MKGKYELVETSFQSPSGSERNRGFFLGSFFVSFTRGENEKNKNICKHFHFFVFYSSKRHKKGTQKEPKKNPRFRSLPFGD